MGAHIEDVLQCQTPAQGSNPDGPAPKPRKTQQDEGMHDAEQRVILVTEPHTDINAGFVVVLDSGHEAPLDIESMDEQASQATGSALDKFWLDLAAEAFAKYRALTLEYLCNCSNPTFLSVEEQGQVIQSGLALSPIAWAHTRYTVDWAIAWALIGEWGFWGVVSPASTNGVVGLSMGMMASCLTFSRIVGQG